MQRHSTAVMRVYHVLTREHEIREDSLACVVVPQDDIPFGDRDINFLAFLDIQPNPEDRRNEVLVVSGSNVHVIILKHIYLCQWKYLQPQASSTFLYCQIIYSQTSSKRSGSVAQEKRHTAGLFALGINEHTVA